jgi:hypothetical protein
MKLGDWKKKIERIYRTLMQDFFLWVLEKSEGRIKSWGTSHVYIRQFQQLYTNVTGSFVNRNDMKEVYKVRTCPIHFLARWKLTARSTMQSF